MTQRINVAELPDFDAAPYLDSEASIAAYLTDILSANDPALLAAALGDIARARHERYRQGIRHYPRGAVQGTAPRRAAALRYHQPCMRSTGREAGGATCACLTRAGHRF